MSTGSSPIRSRSARITSRSDPLRPALWAGGAVLAALAAWRRAGAIVPAGRSTAPAFLTLAVILLAAAGADRVGLFAVLVRLLVPDRVSRRVTVLAVLALTALLSALVNLDVAVVVALPVAVRAAARRDLGAGWLAAAVAVTANAASFLLPTSNLTTLLVLGPAEPSAVDYLVRSWLPWLLVTGLTVTVLAVVVSRSGGGQAREVAAAPQVRAVADLAPMFVAASAIRALLGSGLTLPGGFLEQLGLGAGLAAALNNLPAAAALRAVGPAGRWAAVVAMAVGPNLWLTGSVATLISRRIARDAGVALTALRFTALGLWLVPLQLVAAAAGLRLTGALR